MIINLDKAKFQIKEIEMCISKLYQSKKEINNYRIDLNNNWVANEMTYFNGALENILDDVDRAIFVLDSLKNDMQKELSKIRKM